MEIGGILLFIPLLAEDFPLNFYIADGLDALRDIKLQSANYKYYYKVFIPFCSKPIAITIAAGKELWKNNLQILHIANNQLSSVLPKETKTTLQKKWQINKSRYGWNEKWDVYHRWK